MEYHQHSSGPLRSTVTIELHTHRAAQIWQGRRGSLEEEIYPIIGMPRFLEIMDNMKTDAAQDNPYADIWMILMEERLIDARQEMRLMLNWAQQALHALPNTLKVEGCASIQPVTLPLYASAQLGYLAVYLLTDFDQLARTLLQAYHMAVISREDHDNCFRRSGKIIRRIFALAQRYARVPVTRQDVREDHIRAREAEKLFGPVPIEILEGSRRSKFAPPLQRTATKSAVLSQGDPATEQLLNLPVDIEISQGADNE